MAETNLKKSKQGYGYKYTELAQINDYLESINTRYYQYIETDANGVDYIYTVPIVGDKELPPRRGCRIVNAALQGKTNAAQEQGSAITYARRYSLLMAFGLATEDDDAQALTQPKEAPKVNPEAYSRAKSNLVKLMLEKNVTDEAVCKVFKVKEISQLTLKQIESAIENIDKIMSTAEKTT